MSSAARITIKTIERRRNDTDPVVLKIVNSAGAAVNISGYSFVLNVTDAATAEEPDNRLFTSTGAITDAAGGIVSFPITADDADNAGRFFHNVKITTADGTWVFQEGPYILGED